MFNWYENLKYIIYLFKNCIYILLHNAYYDAYLLFMITKQSDDIKFSKFKYYRSEKYRWVTHKKYKKLR